MNLKKILASKLNHRHKALAKALLTYFQGIDPDRKEEQNTDTNFSSRVTYELKNKVLVGTHHKAGTTWMRVIFEKISRKHSLVFHNLSKDSRYPDEFDLLFETHSKFELGSIQTPFRGMHIIRDPRDVIISGCFYHQKAKEYWLHEPRQKWQGLTYQQKINSYRNIDDRIIFEMENVGKGYVEEIMRWDYRNPHFIEIKYEDLIRDINLTLFHKIFTFLGFPGSAIPEILDIAYSNSLFSGKVNSAHVRSGKVKEWRKYFKPIHRDRFLELFGDCLVRLNYEASDNWRPSVNEKLSYDS